MVEPLLNVRVTSYAFRPGLLLAQAAVGLLLPLAGRAGAGDPRDTRITTHQALNDVGIGGEAYGRSLVERLLDAIAAGPPDRAARPAGDPQHAAPQGPPGPDADRAGVRHGAVCLGAQRAGLGECDAGLASCAFTGTTYRSKWTAPSWSAGSRQLPPRCRVWPSAEVWSMGGARRVRADDTKSNAFRVVAVPPDTR